MDGRRRGLSSYRSSRSDYSSLYDDSEGEKKQPLSRRRREQLVGSSFTAPDYTSRSRRKDNMNQYNGERNRGQDFSQDGWERPYTTHGNNQHYNQHNNTFNRPDFNSPRDNYNREDPSNYYPRNYASDNRARYSEYRGRGGYWRSCKQDYSNGDRFCENTQQNYSQPIRSSWRGNRSRGRTIYRGHNRTYSEMPNSDRYMSSRGDYLSYWQDRNNPVMKSLLDNTSVEIARSALRRANVKLRKEIDEAIGTRPINDDDDVNDCKGKVDKHTNDQPCDVDASLDSRSHRNIDTISTRDHISQSDNENVTTLQRSMCTTTTTNTTRRTDRTSEDGNKTSAQKVRDRQDSETHIITTSAPSILSGSDIEDTGKVGVLKDGLLKMKKSPIGVSKTIVTLNRTNEASGTLPQRKTSLKTSTEASATKDLVLKDKASNSAYKASGASENTQKNSKTISNKRKESSDKLNSENSVLKSSPTKILHKRVSQELQISATPNKKSKLNSVQSAILQEGTVDLLQKLKKRKETTKSQKFIIRQPDKNTRVSNPIMSHPQAHMQEMGKSRKPNKNSQKSSLEKNQKNKTKKSKAKSKRLGAVKNKTQIVTSSSLNIQKNTQKRKEPTSCNSQSKKRKITKSTENLDTGKKVTTRSNQTSSSNTKSITITKTEETVNNSPKNHKPKDRVFALKTNVVNSISDEESREKTSTLDSKQQNTVQTKDGSTKTKMLDSRLISDESNECNPTPISEKKKERAAIKHYEPNVDDFTKSTSHSQVSQSTMFNAEVESNTTKETLQCQLECNDLNSSTDVMGSEHQLTNSKQLSRNVRTSDENLTEVTSTSESIPFEGTIPSNGTVVACSYEATIVSETTEECAPNKKQETGLHSLTQSAGVTSVLSSKPRSLSLSCKLQISTRNSHTNVSDEDNGELARLVQNERHVDLANFKSNCKAGVSSSKPRIIEENYYITYGEFKKRQKLRDTSIASLEQDDITEPHPLHDFPCSSSEEISAYKPNKTQDCINVTRDDTSVLFNAKKTFCDSPNSESVDLNAKEKLNWKVLTVDIPPLAFSWKTLICKLRNFRSSSQQSEGNSTDKNRNNQNEQQENQGHNESSATDQNASLTCKRECIDIQNDIEECALPQIATQFEGHTDVATCISGTTNRCTTDDLSVHRGNQDVSESSNVNSIGVSNESTEDESCQQSKCKTDMCHSKPLGHLNIRHQIRCKDTKDSAHQCLHDIDQFLDTLVPPNSNDVQETDANKNENGVRAQQIHVGSTTGKLGHMERVGDSDESSCSNATIQNMNEMCDQRIILPSEKNTSNLENSINEITVQEGNTTRRYKHTHTSSNENVLGTDSTVDHSRQPTIQSQSRILAKSELKSEVSNNNSYSNDESAMSQYGLLPNSEHTSLPNYNLETLPNSCTEASERRTTHVSRPLEAELTPHSISSNTTVFVADIKENNISEKNDANGLPKSDDTTSVDHSVLPSKAASNTHEVQDIQCDANMATKTPASFVAKDMQNSLNEDLGVVLVNDSPMSPVEMSESTDFIQWDHQSLYDIDLECKLDRLTEGLYAITRIAEIMPEKDPVPLINLMSLQLQELIEELTSSLWFREIYLKIAVMLKSPSFGNRSLDMKNLIQLLLAIDPRASTNTCFLHRDTFTGSSQTNYLSEQRRRLSQVTNISKPRKLSLLSEATQSNPPQTESELLSVDIEGKLENSAEQLFNVTTTMDFLPASDPTCIISLMLPTLRQAMEELSHSLLLREVHNKINVLSVGRNKPQFELKTVHKLLAINTKKQHFNERPLQECNQQSSDNEKDLAHVKAQTSKGTSVTADALSLNTSSNTALGESRQHDKQIEETSNTDNGPAFQCALTGSKQPLSNPPLMSLTSNNGNQTEINVQEFTQHSECFDQSLPNHLLITDNLHALNGHTNIQSTDKTLEVYTNQHQQSSLNHCMLTPLELKSFPASTTFTTLQHTVLTDTICERVITNTSSETLRNEEQHATTRRPTEVTPSEAMADHRLDSTEQVNQQLGSGHQSASECPVNNLVLQKEHFSTSNNDRTSRDHSAKIDGGSAESSSTRELAYTPCVVCGKKSTIQSKHKTATYCCLDHYKHDWYTQRDVNYR